MAKRARFLVPLFLVTSLLALSAGAVGATGVTPPAPAPAAQGGPAPQPSLVSHSLGGRLVLEAVTHLDRRAREVCVLAAAVDDNCLTTQQYAAARKKAARVSVLASRGDRVLRLAYPAGDFFSDLFYDDDDPGRKALGYHGPRPRAEAVLHAQIHDRADYGHGDYFPPSELSKRINKQWRPEAFIYETLLGLPHSWP